MITARDELQAHIYPGQIIGYRHDGQHIRLIGGGAPDDDEIEVEDGGDDASDDEDDSDADDADADDDDSDADDDADDGTKPKSTAKKAAPKPAPPAKKAAAPAKAPAGETKLERALAREREARRAAQRQLATLRQQNETDAEKLEREAEERAQAKYKPIAVRSAVNAALADAHFQGSPARAHKLIDMDAIDVDQGADGTLEVVGLEAQIAELQAEYPELFQEAKSATPSSKKVPAKKAAPKIDGAGKEPVSDEPTTSAEKLAAQYMGARQSA